MRNLFNQPDIGLLVLRLTLGLTIVVHGVNKFLGGEAALAKVGGAMGAIGLNLGPAVVWGTLAALAQTLGGLGIALGIFFRPCAAVLTLTMLVALASQLGGGFSEFAYPLTMVGGFMACLFLGSGRFAVQRAGGA